MSGCKNGRKSESAEMAKRFPIGIPPWHEKYLIWWAAMKGTSKTALAQNLIQDRIEANKDQILEMLGDRAKDLGISVEELQENLLKDSANSADKKSNKSPDK